MDQSTNRFLALADRPFAASDKPAKRRDSRRDGETGQREIVPDTVRDNLPGPRCYFRYGMLPSAQRFAMKVEP